MNDTRQTPETLNAERQQQARDYARSNLAMMKDDSPEAPAAVRRRAFQNEACDPEFLIVAEPAGGQLCRRPGRGGGVFGSGQAAS